MPTDSYFSENTLLNPPVKRAAYSDRTSWLMAEMSRLAYTKFEGDKSLEELAEEIIKKADKPENIVPILSQLMDGDTLGQKEARAQLSTTLMKAKFSLVNIYNHKGTQAFLAKLIQENKEPMLVLAFRGTEADFTDIKADLKADLKSIGDEKKVHRGFYEAFNLVKQDIEQDLAKYPDAPVYITGHSLGGALAIVATQTLACDSVGACYTFGGPRVGNIHYAEHIKTPIYRIVNAADAVPRVPPAKLMNFLVAILKWAPLPFTDWLANFFSRFRDYIHYGDMRYLTHVDDGPDEDGIAYKDLNVISNPSITFTFIWLMKRWMATFGKAAVSDHSILTYCEKLKAHALRRR